MKDNQNRNINYMRISVTDLCNMRCKYCMPFDIEKIPMKSILSYEEVISICKSAINLGINRFKITGGEPFVRKDFHIFLQMLNEVEGLKNITITTNGTLLYSKKDLFNWDIIGGINISLDTLNSEIYEKITGKNELDNVLKTIELCLEKGIKTKINSVLCRGINEESWRELVLLSKDKPLDVRFIELMPIGFGKEYSGVNNESLKEKIIREFGPVEGAPTGIGNGPAEYIHLPGFKGNIGFISPLNKNFCGECNRIRLTATGRIKPCLCYGETTDLMEILRGDFPDKEMLLTEKIREAILNKPLKHHFENKDEITETNEMSRIGG